MALGSFLDLVADHLAQEGLKVHRLPLLLIPIKLLLDPARYRDEDFLLSWNNVVVERRGAVLRAEGFSSLLPRGDEEAKTIFERAGLQLSLLPPLVESVRRNGGYRCASNHVRQALLVENP